MNELLDNTPATIYLYRIGRTVCYRTNPGEWFHGDITATKIFKGTTKVQIDHGNWFDDIDIRIVPGKYPQVGDGNERE